MTELGAEPPAGDPTGTCGHALTPDHDAVRAVCSGRSDAVPIAHGPSYFMTVYRTWVAYGEL